MVFESRAFTCEMNRPIAVRKRTEVEQQWHKNVHSPANYISTFSNTNLNYTAGVMNSFRSVILTIRHYHIRVEGILIFEIEKSDQII